MVLWKDRHVIYKISFCGLVLSIGAYAIGFSLPYWSVVSSCDQVTGTNGLWESCIRKSLTCFFNVHNFKSTSMNAARAMCSTALLLFSVALVSGCCRNFSRCGQVSCQSSGRHIEYLAVFASVVGLAGCIIFSELDQRYTNQCEIGHLYWAFYVVVAALILAGLCGSVLCFFNRPPPRTRAPATLPARRPSGLPVSVQFPVELGDERFHIPYCGDVTPDQLVYGATSTQPPSYEMATSGVNYSSSPVDAAEAPPLYEDVAKDAALSPETVIYL